MWVVRSVSRCFFGPWRIFVRARSIRLHGPRHSSDCYGAALAEELQSTKLRKATPPRTPRSMFLDFLRPGVRSGFECLRGRRHARPSVPTTGTNTPETLNGGCGGSVAFLLVLIVGCARRFGHCAVPKTSDSLKRLTRAFFLISRASSAETRVPPRHQKELVRRDLLLGAEVLGPELPRRAHGTRARLIAHEPGDEVQQLLDLQERSSF